MATSAVSQRKPRRERRSAEPGERFEHLLVLAKAGHDGRKDYRLCRCDCGTEKWIRTYSLTSGSTRSCGCKRDFGRTHGMTRTREWRAWVKMHERCNDLTDPDYGGRGIGVDPAWTTFEGFYADVGPHPGDGYTLERPDVNANYGPGNGHWDTWKAQARNKRNTAYYEHKGERLSLAEIAEREGVRYQRLWERIVRDGWSLQEALSRPIDGTRREPPKWAKPVETPDGRTVPFAVYCRERGLEPHVVIVRLRRGWSWDDAFQQHHTSARDSVKYELNGEMLTVREYCRRVGADFGLVYNRLKRGWTIEDATALPAGDKPQTEP